MSILQYAVALKLCGPGRLHCNGTPSFPFCKLINVAVMPVSAENQREGWHVLCVETSLSLRYVELVCVVTTLLCV